MKIKWILLICLLSINVQADFISVKRGIASDTTSSPENPEWLSQEELGYDNTNSGAMVVTVTNLLNQMLAGSSRGAENISEGTLEISVERKDQKIVMTATLHSPNATPVTLSCYKTDSEKFSCERQVGDGNDPKAKALYQVINEVDYHIETNSRWKSRLQQNGGAVNISVKQSAQTSFGTGYKTDYTVKIGGQSSHIHCESSYDGSAKVPSYDDAGCNHNTP